MSKKILKPSLLNNGKGWRGIVKQNYKYFIFTIIYSKLFHNFKMAYNNNI